MLQLRLPPAGPAIAEPMGGGLEGAGGRDGGLDEGLEGAGGLDGGPSR